MSSALTGEQHTRDGKTLPDGSSGLDARATGRPLRAVLRVPLFYKLSLANGAIILGTAAFVGLLAPELVRSNAGSAGAVVEAAAIGLMLSLIVNGLIVWIALTPLRRLEEVAARVNAGEHSARAGANPVADADFERLVETFNSVLDTASDRNRRLREMASRAQDATEEERRRLARELHDGIAQSLAALNIQVKLARRAESIQVRGAVLDEVSTGIAEAILELRRMARGLRPPALEMLGLGAAIESHARSTLEAAGIAAEIRAENVAGALAADIELALYRILQEGLSNAIRHSGATSVRVELRRGEDHVELEIEDDGHGFDPRSVRDGDRGLGLFGMEERTESHGGQFQLSSEPGTGTRINVVFPIAEGVVNGG
jgi:two-component system, NarL family, sensor histidine kinase UhpB